MYVSLEIARAQLTRPVDLPFFLFHSSFRNPHICSVVTYKCSGRVTINYTKEYIQTQRKLEFVFSGWNYS